MGEVPADLFGRLGEIGGRIKMTAMLVLRIVGDEPGKAPFELAANRKPEAPIDLGCNRESLQYRLV